MTFEEAKKILKKEGFELEKVGRPCSPTIVFTAYESPEICEAMQVVCSAGYSISMVSSRFDDRKARLSLELAENSAPMPGPGEEQPEEKKRIICCSASPKADFYYKHVLDEGNPALAESASQFNDALLNEQGKKIKRLGKEIARLNKIIHKKNFKIEELGKESSRHLEGKMKAFGENFDLEQELKDKNAVLPDVAEELRLSKIREKNLTEVCQKYVKEVEDLREKLANNVVDKIDAQALKSAESALAYKDEVIETLDKELAEAKHELSSLKRPFRPDSTEAVVLFANAYAKAEKKHLRCAEWRNDGKEVSITYILKNGKKSKITLDFTGDEIIFSRTDPDKKPRIHTPELSEEELMKLQEKVCADIAEEGGDLSGVIVLCGKDFIDAIKKMK